jgi:hypothetical protein
LLEILPEARRELERILVRPVVPHQVLVERHVVHVAARRAEPEADDAAGDGKGGVAGRAEDVAEDGGLRDLDEHFQGAALARRAEVVVAD